MLLRLCASIVMIFTCTDAADVCTLPVCDSVGDHVALQSDWSTLTNWQCDVSGVPDVPGGPVEIQLSMNFTVDAGQDGEDPDCGPYIILKAPHTVTVVENYGNDTPYPERQYYICGSSMAKVHKTSKFLVGNDKLYLNLYNTNGMRFRTNIVFTVKGSIEVDCRSGQNPEPRTTCPCSEYVQTRLPSGLTGDNFSINKRLTIGFCSALALLVLMAILFVAYYFYKKREFEKEKAEAVDRGLGVDGAENRAYDTDPKGGIYSEIGPQRTPVKLTPDPYLNLNLATPDKSQGTPYRGSTDSGLYSSASGDRQPGISYQPTPGYASVSGDHQPTPGYASVSGDHQPTPGYASVSGDHQPTPGYASVSGDHQPTPGYASVSGDHQPTPGYASVSADHQPPISYLPTQGYASVDLYAPGNEALGPRSSSQPQLAGFGALPGLSPPKMTPEDVDALYAKPLKRRKNQNSGSHNSSRAASRESLNRFPSRSASQELVNPPSISGSRDMINRGRADVSELTVGYSYDPNGEDRQHNVTKSSNETEI